MDVNTIHETAERLKAEQIPVTEYTHRRWVRSGKIPAAHCGAKALVFYPNVLAYIQRGDAAEMVQNGGIRRVEA